MTSSDYTPRRVVSLQPSATVILHAIGQLDRLAACTKYCSSLCPEVLQHDCKLIADSWTVKAEAIIAAQPDLVIASVPYQEKSVAEILKAGVPFLGLAPKTLADIYSDIAAIAGIMGTPERGLGVITKMQDEIVTIRRQTEGLTRPKVYCEEWGKPLIASQPWVAELVEAAGGEFLGKPGAQTTAEQVRDENPDVLIAAWCGAGERVPLEKIVHSRGWDEMRAVQQGRVYCVRDEFLNTPAPTLVHGLHALAGAIHPDRFPQAAGLRCMTNSISIAAGAKSRT